MNHEGADRTASISSSDGSPQSNFLNAGAVIFLGSLILFLIVIVFIGTRTFFIEQKFETTKRNAESVGRTLIDVGALRNKSKSDLVSCNVPSQGDAKVTWGPCWAEFTQIPSIANLINTVRPENPLFGSACNGSESSYGQIILEKGTSWSSAGSVGVTYAAFDNEVSIATEIAIRVLVCNHWGEATNTQSRKS